jgi:hypothetical protein
MRHNKLTFVILSIAVIGIWGVIIARLSAYSDREDKAGLAATTTTEETLQSGSGPLYTYVSDVRDPFHELKPVLRPNHVRKSTAPPTPAWSPPPFKLTGILVTGRKKTVTLEGPDGAVFFLEKGDTLRGVRIMDIKAQEVTYLFQKKKDKWLLQ